MTYTTQGSSREHAPRTYLGQDCNPFAHKNQQQIRFSIQRGKLDVDVASKDWKRLACQAGRHRPAPQASARRPQKTAVGSPLKALLGHVATHTRLQGFEKAHSRIQPVLVTSASTASASRSLGRRSRRLAFGVRLDREATGASLGQAVAALNRYEVAR